MDSCTDEIGKVLDELKLTSDQEAINTSLDNIIGLLEKEGSDRDACARRLLNGEVLPQLAELLRNPDANCQKVARCIAELVKSEELRVPCVEAGLVPPLVKMVDSKRIPECTEACRALGNICFDNDAGRNATDEVDGVQRLVVLLKDIMDSESEGADRLRMVACGFLLNITNTHESIQEKALGMGVVPLLDSYLQKHCNDEGVCHMALMSVGSLAETEFAKEELCECDILSTVANLLCTPTGQDLQDLILDLLGNLAESDAVKITLAKSKLKDHLLHLLQTCAEGQDDDAQHTEKLASDLLVLLLTGDASMQILYGDGKGPVFRECLNWLSSPRDQLRISGALALGNFARNDDQCISLVKQGITEKLLKLLDVTPEDVNPTLLHAVLSALRNLAIPAVNKPVMLKCGLFEHTLPHITADMAAVQFKLLGTLRMVIDGQGAAATTLGTNRTFLEKLIEWCKVEDHAGVKGEATRLVALLVKHSQSSAVMRAIHSHEGLPHLVHMTGSEHSVMQNEALVALTLISSSVLDDVSSSLAGTDLVSLQKNALTDSKTPPEIVCNVLSLVKLLCASAEIKQQLHTAQFPAVLKKLQSHPQSGVQSQAKAVAAMLGKG